MATTQDQRRHLTLLFADLSDSSRLGRLLDVELYRALLRQLRVEWRAVAQAHGGQVVLTQGDGALIAFGLEDPAANVGPQAVRAALALHQRIGALAPPGVPSAWLPLRIHAGLHAGVVLVAPGHIELGLWDLSGDVANAAARLSDWAPAGHTLATDAVLGAQAHQFVLAEPPAGCAHLDTQGPAQPVRSVLGLLSAKAHGVNAWAARGLDTVVGLGTRPEPQHQFA